MGKIVFLSNYPAKGAAYSTIIASISGYKTSPCGQKDFTSSVALQSARSKELRLHALCLAAKAKSFHEIFG